MPGPAGCRRAVARTTRRGRSGSRRGGISTWRGIRATGQALLLRLHLRVRHEQVQLAVARPLCEVVGLRSQLWISLLPGPRFSM